MIEYTFCLDFSSIPFHDFEHDVLDCKVHILQRLIDSVDRDSRNINFCERDRYLTADSVNKSSTTVR